MVDVYILYKVLHKIKEIITIKKFYNTKILINTDGILPDNIDFKKVVALMTYVIKDGNKFIHNYF